MKMRNKKINSTPKKVLVTHDGSFHCDDIFAAATIALYLESRNEKFKIIRSRDQRIIDDADYVFDVGGIYDSTSNRFDHHQAGSAGKRVSGGKKGEISIEYASFGLVWKKFGRGLCGSEKAFDAIEKKLVAPVDAWDNGLNLVHNKSGVSPYFVQHVFYSMKPTWREQDRTEDKMFLRCVKLAKEILSREIVQATDGVMAEELVFSAYKKTKDKRIIVLNKRYPYEYTLQDFPKPLFVIYPREDDNGVKNWGIKAIRKDLKNFENKKDFPKSWAGLRNEELQKVTGVKDAIFCHRGLFLCVVKSKEGAIKLAKIAVES